MLVQSARTLQEELLAAADEERTAREKATSELQKALAHTARMQALGDAALEETGTVSEQVFALQEDLIEKDQMIRAIEHERQLLLHELEEMQARLLHDDVGQQRQLMDAAASELSKLKSHNLQLQEEMSTLQEQLAQRDAYGTDFMSNSNMSVQPASDHMSVQPASEQLEAALREETRLLHQCEQQLASTQQQNAQLEERIQGQIREMDAIHGDLLRHQEASQQQHATMRQLELELIENQERLRESDWQVPNLAGLTVSGMRVFPVLLLPSPPLTSPSLPLLLFHCLPALTCMSLAVAGSAERERPACARASAGAR